MKRLLMLTVLGALLGGVAGCRFMECLWRGGPCPQNQAPAATCPNPCPTYSNPCDPCGERRLLSRRGRKRTRQPPADWKEANREENTAIGDFGNDVRRGDGLPYRRVLELRLEFAVPPRAERPALPAPAAVRGRRSVLRSVLHKRHGGDNAGLRLRQHGGDNARLWLRHARGYPGAHGGALDSASCRTDFLIRPVL